MYESIPPKANLNDILKNRRIFARDENTPTSTLVMLFFDTDNLTKFEAARNPNMNFEVARQSLESELDFYQACGIAMNENAPSSLLFFLSKRMVEFEHELTLEQTQILMLHLVKNKNLPPEALTALSHKIVKDIQSKYGDSHSIEITTEEASLL